MAELIIDRNYYNKLDIEGFSKMMSSPSYCYKFYWLEAIVQLISANRTEATYDEIINKMIVNAWFPVQEYHIHLSGIYGEGEVKDNLEKAVSRLFKLSDLPSNADEIQIVMTFRAEDSLYLVAFILAEESLIHKYAGQLPAYCF